MTGGAETLAVAERPRAMAHPRLRVAIVGVGSMGSNHARVVAESAAAQLALIVDSDMARARAVAHRYGCPAAAHLDGLSACDAVIVSTSTEEHTRIGLEVIAAGKPLLVEKPVSERLGEVEELLQAAATADIPLMCGFVERFNPVISTMLTAIDEPVRHFVAIRHSPPNPTTTGVVHDLLIHDLDLAIRLNGGDEPDDVSGHSGGGLGKSTHVVDCTMRFPDSMLATISASRASQRKLRALFVETDTQHWELDLLRATVTVYRHVRHEIANRGYRAETVIDIPFVRHAGEPLALQFEHFVALAGGEVDAAAERRSVLPAHRVADRILRAA